MLTELSCPLHVGTSLKDAGGESFMAAVKELSGKQSLAVGDGKISFDNSTCNCTELQ